MWRRQWGQFVLISFGNFIFSAWNFPGTYPPFKSIGSNQRFICCLFNETTRQKEPAKCRRRIHGIPAGWRLITHLECRIMTKGVPRDSRTCIRCGQSYQPRSGPQRYCSSCMPTMKMVYGIEWRRRNPGRRKIIDKRRMEKNPQRYRMLKKFAFQRQVENMKQLVLGHYSNETIRCLCCGESERDFLVIDHINGHGNEHRKQIFGRLQGGYAFYRWLVKQGYPPGFQVLCSNCNMSKAKHGVCVHVAKPKEPTPPLGARMITRPTRDRRIRGHEASLVRWRPRS